MQSIPQIKTMKFILNLNKSGTNRGNKKLLKAV